MNLVDIVRTRELPYAGTVVVQKGQMVRSDEIVAEMNFYPGMVRKLFATRELAIKPQKLPEVVRVSQGDLVAKGDVLAFCTQWYRPQIMLAPQSGIVGMISRHLGIIYLRKLTEFNTNPLEIFNIAEELGLVGDLARRSILVRVGQRVVPGQILAQKTWEGSRLKMTYVVTRLFGVVKSIKDCVVTVESRQISQKLTAWLSGEVLSTEKNWSVTIKAKAYRLVGTYGLAGERSGTLRTVDQAQLTSSDIGESDHHKVLAVRGRISQEALLKAADIGVAAIIGAGCKLSVLRQYAGDDFIPGITGNEQVGTGVVLLQNFSGTMIDEESWLCLKNNEGNQVALNGTTHIRAGAIRPEVLIFPTLQGVK